MNVDKPMKQ